MAEKLYIENNDDLEQAFNFGPESRSSKKVSEVAQMLLGHFNSKDSIIIQPDQYLHEEKYLELDSTKARKIIGWKPTLEFDEAIEFTSNWFKGYGDRQNLFSLTLQQIKEFERMAMIRDGK